jgi:hypothetical protein
LGIIAFWVAIGFATLAQLWQHHDPRHYCSMPVLEYRKQSSNEYGSVEMEGISSTTTRQSAAADEAIAAMVDETPLEMIDSGGASPSSLIASPDLISATTAKQGLFVAILGGCCFGFFSPCFNIAVNDPFHWTSNSSNGFGGLSVLEANLWFSFAFALLSILGNIYLMACTLPSSNLWTYLTNEAFRDRCLAIVAGSVCALGNLLQFQGGKLAGFAAADLVQAFPLVATMWGVWLFGEFRKARPKVIMTLIVMFISYISGIFLMAASISRHER